MYIKNVVFVRRGTVNPLSEIVKRAKRAKRLEQKVSEQKGLEDHYGLGAEL